MLEYTAPTVRQCAWCLLVVDATGSYTVRPGRKLKAATHGICPGCKGAVRAEIDRRGPLSVTSRELAAA